MRAPRANLDVGVPTSGECVNLWLQQGCRKFVVRAWDLSEKSED